MAEVVHGDTISPPSMAFTAFIDIMSRLPSSVSIDADMAGEVVAVEDKDPPVKLSETFPATSPSEAVPSRLDPNEGQSCPISVPAGSLTIGK